MDLSRIALSITLAACSSASPAAERPEQPPQLPPDASIDAPAPDASAPQAVIDAPAWVFRYSTADRKETWTLRHVGGSAMLVVESASGSLTYLGTAVAGPSLALDVSTGSAKMTLECKPAKRSLSAKCNDAKAKPVEVLDCFHKGFKEPMPFGAAPGVEYTVAPGCNGYRLVTP
ncbi:MAG: hypothetical protein H0T46_03540 [Deltaproteobacteria bacterium]|nr:hypothetical protein [Deltaproteobacteria bacterium]